MASKKFKLLVAATATGFSALHEDEGVLAVGSTLTELKAEAVSGLNLALEDTGRTVTEDDLVFAYVLGSFFKLYPVINVKALAARLGMQQSSLAGYIGGQKKASAKQTQRILEGVRAVGRELASIEIV
jgi:hypothetical protein